MCKKSLLMMLLLALLVPWAAKAQTTVTIGEGTATSNTNPIGTYYNYSITEQLYTAEEIGTAGTISSISFYYMGIAAKDLPITVYMANVDAENLTSGISLADAEQVFSGTLPVTTTAGWVTITLDTPFAYDGTSNLLIGCIKDYLYYFSGQSWQGTATTTTMARYTQSDSAGPYTTSTVPATAQPNRPNIQMVITAGSGPVCEKPETFEVSNVTTTTATLTWTGGSGNYNVEYKGGSVADWTAYLTNTTATTANLTGLTPGTAYQYRVQSVCGDQTSGWKSLSFSTMFAIPLVEPFGAAIPTGWSMYTGLLADGTATLAAATYCWSFGTGNNVFDNHARVNIYGNYQRWLVMPAVLMESNVQLTFDLALTVYTSGSNASPTAGGQPDDKFIVLISTDNMATWNVLRQWDNAGSEYVYDNITNNAVGEPVAIDLSSYAGQNVIVAFYGESTESNGDNNLHIDNVSIDYIPACAKPTGVAVSDVTAHTATISWTSDAAAWQVQLGEETPIDVTEPTYTFTGLTPETAYSAKVRANCGGTYSEWTNPVSFTTAIACHVPTGLATSNLTGHGATITWTAEEGAWYQSALVKTAEYDANNITWSESFEGNSQTWNNLDPETGYTFALRKDCGSEDGYSSVVTRTFTTTVACPAPTVAVTNITTTTADVTCTNTEATEFNLQLINPNVTPADTTLIENVAIPYTLTGLTQNTSYKVRVQALCGGDGESAWSSGTTFMTAEECPDGMVCIGTGTATSNYVPANNFYNYSLTEQIYTAAEIGMAGQISSIEFFKASTTAMAVNLDIYMVSTTKDEFTSTSDWITVTTADLVYSGTVTFTDNDWTTIDLDVPFNYDGTSNLCIVVDNNTGDYESSTPFRVFTATKNQALYQYSDGSNFDPTAASIGTASGRTTLKNRIRIAIGEPPACPKPTGLTVNYEGGTEATISWNSDATAWNMRVNGTPINGTITNPYTLTGLELATTYEVEVQANCGSSTSEWAGPVSFTTDACMPEDQIVVNYALTDSWGDGWNGNAILVVDENCNIVNQLTIESGNSASGTLKVCGSYVQFLWYKGSYPTETSWVFTDNAGNVLFEGAGSADMATLDVLYTIDNNPYSAPADVAASEVGPRSAKLSWTETGTATAWQIKLTAGDDEEGTIIDANSNPFVITGLTPETEYFAQVRAIGTNGNSIWTCLGADFTTTEACPAPQNIVVSDITASSALVSWLGFGESYDLRYVAMPSSKGMRSSINKKPAKTDFNCKTSFGNVKFASSNDKPAMVSGVTGVQHNRDGWYYYDNGVHAEDGGIGTSGGNFYWGIMIPAGSYLETTLTKTSVYDELAMTGTVTIYNDGTDAPAGDALAQADVTLTGAGAFVETEFSEPVTIDPSKNLWIVYYNGSGATYPAATCTAQGDANGRWVSIDGTSWMDVASAVEGCGNFMVRAYLEGAIEIDWIEVPGITASEYELTGLDPETTYLVQIRSNCGDEGQSDYAGTNFTTMSLCDNPYDLDTIEVNATSAILNWTGAQESYNLRYRHAAEVDPTAPAIIILEAHDTWGDGTGYQMLLDADATALGVEIPESGPYTGTDYSAFEYLIPENADCDSNTENLVFDGSVTLEIPAGVYDWCIINPEPGGNMWISGTGDIPGRYNDYVFEPGVTYHFTMQRFGSGDGAALEITRPMSDWTVVENVTNPYELTGLTDETYYEWQIQGINEECDELEWVAGPNFTTLVQTIVTQTIALAEGWNYVSTYVEITLDDLKAALVAAMPGVSSIKIQSKDQNTTYNGSRWRGSLTTLNVEQMYMIETQTECEITLEGTPLNPAEHPITINEGSTWIGFPFAADMSLTDAFTGFAVNGDKVSSKEQNATYNGTRWRGTLNTLVPGQGYIYNSTTARTFVYPTGSSK